MKIVRVFVLAVILGACSCTPEVASVTPAKRVENRTAQKALTAKEVITPSRKTTKEVQAPKPVVKQHAASSVKSIPKAKAPEAKPAVTLKASPSSKPKATPKATPAVKHVSHEPAAPAKKVEAKTVEKVGPKPKKAVTLKATPKSPQAAPSKKVEAKKVEKVKAAKATVASKSSSTLKFKERVAVAETSAKPEPAFLRVVPLKKAENKTVQTAVAAKEVVTPSRKATKQVKAPNPPVKQHAASPVKSAPKAKAPESKPAVTLKGSPSSRPKATPKAPPAVKHVSHEPAAPAKKVEAKTVEKVKAAKPIATPKSSGFLKIRDQVKGAKPPAKPKAPLLKAVPVKRVESTTLQEELKAAEKVFGEFDKKVAEDAPAKPVALTSMHRKASAPAPSPAAAPAGAGDWRHEYGHSSNPKELEWKWTTHKPGSYSINTKAPPKLLPIGEGAYQSAEAVAQRTKDKSSDCESGKWNDCFLKHGGNLTDGHVYGNLKGKYGNGPAKSGATATGFGLAALSLLLPSLVF